MVDVPVVCVDDVLAQYTDGTNLGLMLLDTEGLEPEVVRGTLKAIRKSRPIILTEARAPPARNRSRARARDCACAAVER